MKFVSKRQKKRQGSYDQPNPGPLILWQSKEHAQQTKAPRNLKKAKSGQRNPARNIATTKHNPNNSKLFFPTGTDYRFANLQRSGSYNSSFESGNTLTGHVGSRGSGIGSGNSYYFKDLERSYTPISMYHYQNAHNITLGSFIDEQLFKQDNPNSGKSQKTNEQSPPMEPVEPMEPMKPTDETDPFSDSPPSEYPAYTVTITPPLTMPIDLEDGYLDFPEYYEMPRDVVKPRTENVRALMQFRGWAYANKRRNPLGLKFLKNDYHSDDEDTFANQTLKPIGYEMLMGIKRRTYMERIYRYKVEQIVFMVEATKYVWENYRYDRKLPPNKTIWSVERHQLKKPFSNRRNFMQRKPRYMRTNTLFKQDNPNSGKSQKTNEQTPPMKPVEPMKPTDETDPFSDSPPSEYPAYTVTITPPLTMPIDLEDGYLDFPEYYEMPRDVVKPRTENVRALMQFRGWAYANKRRNPLGLKFLKNDYHSDDEDTFANQTLKPIGYEMLMGIKRRTYMERIYRYQVEQIVFMVEATKYVWENYRYDRKLPPNKTIWSVDRHQLKKPFSNRRNFMHRKPRYMRTNTFPQQNSTSSMPSNMVNMSVPGCWLPNGYPMQLGCWHPVSQPLSASEIEYLYENWWDIFNYVNSFAKMDLFLANLSPNEIYAAQMYAIHGEAFFEMDIGRYFQEESKGCPALLDKLQQPYQQPVQPYQQPHQSYQPHQPQQPYYSSPVQQWAGKLPWSHPRRPEQQDNQTMRYSRAAEKGPHPGGFSGQEEAGGGKASPGEKGTSKDSHNFLS
ncbi:uncharacterized protein Dere_GG17885 [Drosophila erecta]|uniref:Uncharacterized protein n=1 Tax=Drosophila erecta TaxID=7220 RepID=B3NTK4_DROER|nr:uncharacterized protein Dere_GG17885 [Drosophila erecta]